MLLFPSADQTLAYRGRSDIRPVHHVRNVSRRRIRECMRLKPGERVPRWLRRLIRPHFPIGWSDRLRRLEVFNTILVVQPLTIAEATGVSTLQSAAFGSSPVGGNTIIVFVALGTGVSPHVTTITDTQGNSYGPGRENTAARYCGIWFVSNITGGSTFKITVNTNVATNITFGAIEVSGLATSSALDSAQVASTGTSTTPSTGASGTLAQNVELVCIAVCPGNTASQTITTPGGFSSQVKEQGNTFQELDGATMITASNASINAQWLLANSATWNTVLCAFKTPSAISPVWRRRKSTLTLREPRPWFGW